MSSKSPSFYAEVPGTGRFKVTDAAIRKIETLESKCLYCYCGPGGCAGVGLLFAQGLPPTSAFEAIPIDGTTCRISIEDTLQSAVLGATLDYGASLKPPRFRWIRLKAENRCGCRRSFGRPTHGIQTDQCLSKEEQLMPSCVSPSGI